MAGVTTTRGTRPRSAIVFLILVGCVVGLAAGSLLLRGPATVLPQGIAPAAMSEADWSADGEAAKAAGLSLTLAADPAALPLLRDDVAADAFAAEVEAPAEDRVATDDALIVRTGSLELEVEDVAVSLDEARAEIGALGGYVAGSDEIDQGESRWATVTYRVPVERFAEAIEALRGLADRVVRESTQSAEVTATVVDLDARIGNLRASEAALVEIMDRAGRIDDVLAVQARLEVVRGQIEQLEAQRDSLADQAALSTLTVSWLTPVAAVAVVREGWDVAAEVDAALARTVEALQGLASLAIWFAVVVLPLVIVPLLMILAVALVLRRRGRVARPATE